MRDKFFFRFKNIRRLFNQYEGYLITGALLLGIITDVALFSSVNFKTVFIILTVHFVFSGLVIAFIHLYNEGFFRFKTLRFLRLLSPLFLQYSFGALLSGTLIFYWFSSSFLVSWPFIFIIIVLILSNDLLKRYYLWLPVQIGVYFFICFSLSVLILPFILKDIGFKVFLIGGLFSLIIITLYLYEVSKFLTTVHKNKKKYAFIIGSIFITMNVFYFFNIIPPVPLSLKEAEVAYFVEKTELGYLMELEDRSIWDRLMISNKIYITDTEAVYFFSSVFAPALLKTDVVHRWQYFDKDENRWTDRAVIKYPVVGGRDGGYRGYSLINSVFSGRWRVLVETEKGQVIGKKNFKVVEGKAQKLKEELR